MTASIKQIYSTQTNSNNRLSDYKRLEKNENDIQIKLCHSCDKKINPNDVYSIVHENTKTDEDYSRFHFKCLLTHIQQQKNIKF